MERIVDRDYYLSSHAEEEMMDDGFERADVENAILKGFLEKRMTHDTRELGIVLKAHLFRVAVPASERKRA
ncbi:DUF4258 domain-containing protein [Thiocystis violacea]|uniref:DUF4258 domain-containing protein n=1 Tax=Thiocystis violacea TaxID=13725 RepID=UPI003B839C80|nr:hypothetical protein [Thiocystis violacea]